jgi:hypothetical protein
MKIILTVMLLLFTVQFGLGQNNIIVKGKVTFDSGKKRPGKKIISGARVLFRDGSREYYASSDEKGNCSISLPPGTYFVFSSGPTWCRSPFAGMCPEFSKDGFVIGKKPKVKLDIALYYVGEG